MERVQERFQELAQGAKELLHDPDNPNVFVELTLGEESRSPVWWVHVQTNEIPPKVLGMLGPVVEEINQEEDFAFHLTLDPPKTSAFGAGGSFKAVGPE